MSIFDKEPVKISLCYLKVISSSSAWARAGLKMPQTHCLVSSRAAISAVVVPSRMRYAIK